MAKVKTEKPTYTRADVDRIMEDYNGAFRRQCDDYRQRLASTENECARAEANLKASSAFLECKLGNAQQALSRSDDLLRQNRRRQKIAAIVAAMILWLSLGVIGVGFDQAHYRATHPMADIVELRQSVSEHGVVSAIFGPIYSILSFLHSGWGYYGWSLSTTPMTTSIPPCQPGAILTWDNAKGIIRCATDAVTGATGLSLGAPSNGNFHSVSGERLVWGDAKKDAK